MNIFLTGHRGFIGAHLHKKLQSLRYDVYTDLASFHFRTYDAIIHLAAITHTRLDFDPHLFESNIILTQKMLTTPYRTLYASSCSAEHLSNPYAYTKRYAEWLGEKHGNALGLRFFNVYGPGNNKGIVWFLNNKKDGDEVIVRGPDLVRDYIYIDNVVDEIVSNIRGYKLLHESERGVSLSPNMMRNVGIKEVGTGKGTSTMELVEMYQKLAGVKFKIITQPAGDHEPQSMISKRAVVSPLPFGLKTTISVCRQES